MVSTPHERAPPQSLTRRMASLGLLAGALSQAGARPAPILTILGDSITAGYGLPAAAGLPARLHAALARLGIQVVVRGAAVSGDTTAGGLARVDFSVQPDTTLCLVELGGNDLLRGLEPAATKANLIRIIRRLKARRIAVVLVGITAPAAIGAGYARDFNALFAQAAAAGGAPLYPDLLAGVGQGRRQADGIHPNALGVDIIADRLARFLAPRLGER